MRRRAESALVDLGGGALCLDFVNTLDQRPSDAPVEQIASYEDLLGFAGATGNLTAQNARALLVAARQDPGAAADALRWAIDVREALYRLLSSALDATPPDPADVGTLAEAIADAGASERLDFAGGRFTLGWRAVDDDGSVRLDRPLWPVARSAALLLTGALPGTLRECAAEGCAALFLDTTRNQSRRWCSRAGCGNRERVRRFRQRAAAGAPSPR